VRLLLLVLLLSQQSLNVLFVTGVWPLDTQSNTMVALTNEEIPNGYLPPEMDLSLTFHKWSNPVMLVQRPSQEDEHVYHATNACPEVVAETSVKWEFLDMRIVYEVLEVSSTDMEGRARTSKYFVDVPRTTIQPMEAGLMQTSNSVHLPPGVKFVALTFPWGDHVIYKETANRPLSARFSFPPNATNVWVGFEGEKGMLFDTGFKELGTEKAYQSFTSKEYYRQLYDKGLYHRKFDKMFPKGNIRSYDDVLIFDLTAYKLTTPSVLKVLIDYTPAASLPNYKLCSMLVQQYEYTYHDGDELKTALVL